MENVITLGKMIGLLFCSLPPLYIVFENSKNTRNEHTRPVMGTIFLVLDMIGHKLVDSELVHAELTTAGSALVEVFFFSLKIFKQVWQKTVSSASL